VNAYKATLIGGLFDWRTYKMESGNPAVYRCFLKAWKEYIKQGGEVLQEKVENRKSEQDKITLKLSLKLAVMD